jgi:hypothetical protein
VKYLLIAFVVFVALAPLLHFIPSKRQRQIARLRELAAGQGLFVEFRSPPTAGEGRPPPPGAGSLFYYGKRLPRGKGAPIRRSSWVRDDWGWRGLDRPAEAPQSLSSLPPDITLAAVDEGSCGVFWNEEGGEEALAEIQRVLEEWSAQLRPGSGDFA